MPALQQHARGRRTLGLLIAAPLIVSGCANLSGVGGSSEYGCKAPEGVRCESVSGNYYNAIQNNLPTQRKGREGSNGRSNSEVTPGAANEHAARTVPASRLLSRTGHMPTSLRAAPKILRLWYKPWEDADRDLNDQGYVYVQTEGGRWLIDHAQKTVRDAYQPVRPPRNLATGQSASSPPVARPPNADTSASAEDGAGAQGAATAVDALKRNAQTANDNQ